MTHIIPSAARASFLAEAGKRLLITDGAFGTEIQNWKLSEADYAGDLGLVAKDDPAAVPDLLPDNWDGAVAEMERALLAKLYPLYPSSRKLAARLQTSHSSTTGRQGATTSLRATCNQMWRRIWT